MGSDCGAHRTWGIALPHPEDHEGNESVMAIHALALRQHAEDNDVPLLSGSEEPRIANILNELDDQDGGPLTPLKMMESLLDPVMGDGPVKKMAKHFGSVLSILGLTTEQVPRGAKLFWTGDGDDRPATCLTVEDAVLLGFGSMGDPCTPPYDPKAYPEFHALAGWHEWIWCSV